MVCSIWLGLLHSGVLECFPGVYELFAGCSVLVLDGSCYTSLLFCVGFVCVLRSVVGVVAWCLVVLGAFWW